MTRAAPADDPRMTRLAQAAAWRVRLTEQGAETSPEFEAWLGEEGAAEAWARVQAPWAQVGEQATSPEMMAARAGALARARGAGRRRWASTTAGRIAAGLAAVVLAAGGYGAWRWIEAQPATYRTTLGERRVVPLPDGSKVSLDSRSVVRIRYTDDARRLVLVSGQARFDVAHDVTRPFSVTARDQTVVATGTAFNVDLMGPKVLVTLIEGQVVVVDDDDRAPAKAPARKPKPVILKAGEQLVAAPAAPPKIEVASLERATAWEAGRLAFQDEPLGQVAERVGRYSDRPLAVAPDVAAMRISGVFKTGDIDTFVDVVTHYLPVAATEDGGKILLKSRG